MVSFGSLATSYYFNYLFFFLRDRFGFENRGNLTVAAIHGGIYVFASVQGGRYAERHDTWRMVALNPLCAHHQVKAKESTDAEH